MNKSKASNTLLAGLLSLLLTSIAAADVEDVVVPPSSSSNEISNLTSPHNSLAAVIFLLRKKPDVIEPVPTVVSATGKVWMDRNLGASQVATSVTDTLAYGYYYQWGRPTDGHEDVSSSTTPVQSATDVPGHGSFIIGSADWRATQNDTLWQGAAGINNPCPTGFRLPTRTELEEERASWTTDNAAGAYDSPLKLVMSGLRQALDGSLLNTDLAGWYWASTPVGANSAILTFDSTSASVLTVTAVRAHGLNVRCIQD